MLLVHFIMIVTRGRNVYSSSKLNESETILLPKWKFLSLTLSTLCNKSLQLRGYFRLPSQHKTYLLPYCQLKIRPPHLILMYVSRFIQVKSSCSHEILTNVHGDNCDHFYYVQSHYFNCPVSIYLSFRRRFFHIPCLI